MVNGTWKQILDIDQLHINRITSKISKTITKQIYIDECFCNDFYHLTYQLSDYSRLINH